MAVPSSGTLHLSKIANEKHFDNYDQAQLPTPPYSLTDISTSGNSPNIRKVLNFANEKKRNWMLEN